MGEGLWVCGRRGSVNSQQSQEACGCGEAAAEGAAWPAWARVCHWLGLGRGVGELVESDKLRETESKKASAQSRRSRRSRHGGSPGRQPPSAESEAGRLALRWWDTGSPGLAGTAGRGAAAAGGLGRDRLYGVLKRPGGGEGAG